MGFKARKSFKLAPGVRMTVSSRGVSYSAGVKGARITRQANGRVTRTLSAPGTGISHTKTLSAGPGGGRSAPTSPAPEPRKATPGIFAPKWEKALYKALILKPEPASIEPIGSQYPEARMLTATFGALHAAIPAGDNAHAREMLEYAYAGGFDPAKDQFCQKYLPNAGLEVEVAAGVAVLLPLSREALGLTLAELHQEAGDLEAAVAVVEALDPSTVAAVSLAELYSDLQRWNDVVDLTEGLSNDDEPSTYLLTQRGIALRELGLADGAREAFKEALRVRNRPAELRHRVLVERALTYLAQGKTSMARKDLEKVYAENSRYPGLRDVMASLPQ